MKNKDLLGLGVILIVIGFIHLTPGQKWLDLVQQKGRNGDTIIARNRSWSDLTVFLEVTGSNFNTSHPIPLKAVIAPHTETPILRISPRDNQAWSYRYTYKSYWGNINARPDPILTYDLPYPSGSGFKVIQSYNGSSTHKLGDTYCIDFVMPEGTPVCAAREGTVAMVEDSFNSGGYHERFRDMANFIHIRHADRTTAIYVHLKWRGATVQPGQWVARGQVIGYSGNTGYSGSPHLHFGVFTIVSPFFEGKSFPVKFRTGQGTQSLLREGDTYTAL